MAVENILEEIGLTKNEIKVYLALLKLGSTTTGSIIKESKAHNSKVYDSLERLINKGLVTYVIVENTKHFKAVSPERLVDFLKNKKNKIIEQEKEIRRYIPELKTFYHLMEDKTNAEVFQGWRGMETVFNDGISEMKKKDVWYVLGAYQGEDKEKTDNFIKKIIIKCEKKKIKWKIIYNESARNTFQYEQKSKITENRFLSQETPATINIYKDISIEFHSKFTG